MRQVNEIRLKSLVDGLAYAESYPRNYELVRLGSTAHLRVRGTLMSDDWFYWSASTYRSLSSALEEARLDDQIKRIVLSINSPGGEVDGLFECGRSILETRKEKPVLALIEGMGCSAAYLVAACCSKVVATPYSEVGSCGVQAEVVDWSGWEEKTGIISRIFHSKNAQKKNLDPSTEEGAKAIQERIDYAEAGYFEMVAEGRGMDRDTCMERFGHGAVLKVEEALEAGMIDAIQTIDEAVETFEADEPQDIQNINSSPLGSEGVGGEMDQNTGAGASQDQIRREAAAAERQRIRALEGLRDDATAAIIDRAIEDGSSVADVAEELIEAMRKENENLRAEIAKIRPIAEQAAVQTDVAGMPASAELDAYRKGDAAAREINEEIAKVNGKEIR